MMTPPLPPSVLAYGRPAGRKLSYWALAAPVVAAGAFMLEIFLGAELMGDYPSLAYLAYVSIVLCSLGSIIFSVQAIRRIRRSRGLLLGTTSAVLAICFSVCTGLLCPGFADSLGRSRHIAGTSVTKSQMFKIVQACQAYAEGHDEHFPPHLAVLLTAGSITPGQLLDRNAPVELKPFPTARLVAPADWRAIAADIEAHCDFTYVGADLTSTLDESLIALYTKPGRIHRHMKFPEETWDGQGRLVAYADGHTELVLDADLPAVLARGNAVRVKRGLRPVTLDGPPPGP